MQDEFGTALELGMQELEAMEAPAFWTAVGVGVGIVVSVSAAYASFAVSAIIVT
ncbi:daptide-type RiPP [Streptacidiphilus sp. N1-12]|uniref:Daptide-type RiPP n=2 Tax=Streptacidiphilus alkalitolerans TaxID=3342712 RepID=A0ABV6W8B7_9ACTN